VTPATRGASSASRRPGLAPLADQDIDTTTDAGRMLIEMLGSPSTSVPWYRAVDGLSDDGLSPDHGMGDHEHQHGADHGDEHVL
jgi:hypothetical protein